MLLQESKARESTAGDQCAWTQASGGFRVYGFRGSGVEGFRSLGFRVLGVQGLRGLGV